MLQINTGDLKNRKKVLIDGHEYIVRKLGAGEELQVSQIMRELERLGKKEKSGATMTEADQSKAIELAERMYSIFYGTFNDGGDGSKAKALLTTLSEAEIKELQEMIFNGESNATVEQPAAPAEAATDKATEAVDKSAGVEADPTES